MNERDFLIDDIQEAMHTEISRIRTVARLLRDDFLTLTPHEPVDRGTCATILEGIAHRLGKVAGPPKEPEL